MAHHCPEPLLSRDVDLKKKKKRKKKIKEIRYFAQFLLQIKFYIDEDFLFFFLSKSIGRIIFRLNFPIQW